LRQNQSSRERCYSARALVEDAGLEASAFGNTDSKQSRKQFVRNRFGPGK